MLKVLFLFSNILSLSMESILMSNYSKFLDKYNKSFSEEGYSTYKENVLMIEELNKQNNSYDIILNEFGDIKNEYRNTMEINKNKNIIPLNDIIVPEKKDWRNEGVITEVKNQEDCGSCWAFSTTGSVEGIVAIKSSNLFNFSEQQLIDCSDSYGNNGCEGGLMDNGFKYVIDNGLCLEKDYPYKAESGMCQQCDEVGHIDSYGDIESDEKVLKRAVAQQPVSVAIQANLTSFRFYSKGVYSDPNCGDALDHGVLIVGYGYDMFHGKDYWIVKNSWGKNWGENGYIRIERNVGMCGIELQASIPLIKNNDIK